MIKPRLCTDSLGRVFFRCELIDNQTIKTTWSGNMIESGPAMEAAKMVVDFLESANARKILDDNRMGLGKWPDIEEWMSDVWIPRLVKSGLTAYAHVLSPDSDAKEPARRLFNITYDQASFATFDNFQSAHEWLKSV